MEDLKSLMRENYVKYASYVILDRAIPNVVDGLKPVQRRILQTLFTMHDGKLHKVANVAGQTMVYHPHGDAAIIEALVHLANMGFLLEKQGNFGNSATGDPPAAARYIETKLSPLALETLFNPDITETMLSYDGRHHEPVTLPAKIPLLLMQGAQGIAVGMATHVLPHNFKELLEAMIAILEDKSFKLIPDFPQGGVLDASEYDKGKGKVKLRAKIEVRDPKTLVIREICYGTTTESLIQSIDEAAKKGKIKIEAICDYTSDHIEIEIKLPRGQYADDLIKALYAYTECEVTLHSQILVIKDKKPWETTVDEILIHHVMLLKDYLKAELEIEKERYLKAIYSKNLERLFIENRLYKALEKVETGDKLEEVISKGLRPFHDTLGRAPSDEEIRNLLLIPIRRISLFDLEKNKQEILNAEKELKRVEKALSQMKKTTITYISQLLTKYGKDFPRHSSLEAIEEIDVKAIAKHDVKVGFDLETGFVGTRVSGQSLNCTSYSKLLALFRDGSYRVIQIPEKQYVASENNPLVALLIADKETILNAIYKDPKTHIAYAKRFIVKQFILDKTYRYFDEGMTLLYLSPSPTPSIELFFFAKMRQKIASQKISFDDFLIKGVGAKGIRLSKKGVKNIRWS